MTQMVKAKRAPVRESKPTKVPVITWGADEATILANGNSRTTQPGSIFAQEGLNIELFREDNFARAVDKVISGETPYLRGTSDMIMSALEALKAQGIEMEVIYVLSRSTGGDTITVRSDMVKTAADLCGKPIGVQLYGPHMYYLATVLKDAGCPESVKNVRWLRELTLPPYDPKGVTVDPASAMQRDIGLAAVTVITPDMLALTAGDTIGTGAEGVKGAKKLLSTKTGGNIIFDWYAVRKDYLDSHRAEVQAFAHGLLRGQEALVELFNAQSQRQGEYNAAVRVMAQILRDNEQLIADVEGMYLDMTFMGYRSNVAFFTDTNNLRGFEVIKKEVQDALLGYGLLSGPVSITYTKWDYNALAKGLKDTAGVVATKYDPVKVQQVVQEREVQGRAGEGILFEFEINFLPNQKAFDVEQYATKFDQVVSLAAKYPGAIIVVEGHADRDAYDKLKSQRVSDQVLNNSKQYAKNLSLGRAIEVRDSVIVYAKSRNLTLDPTQFTVVGSGFDKLKYISPKSEVEWLANKRVVFRIIQVESELDRFTPKSGQ
jgi:ABC-type nitrate/sulfonate/bicarbonate transport system substrate-binding protein/outer membrane protein OmpA-like peptidoglycan-associated protein